VSNECECKLSFRQWTAHDEMIVAMHENAYHGPCLCCAIQYNTAVTIRSIASAVLATTAVFSFLCAPEAAAQGTPVRVLVSNGMKAAMEELQPQCERAIGHPLALEYNSTASLKKKIEAGEVFDATIITTEAIADLIKQGKLASGSRADLARSELGIGISAGAAKPDIHTVDALKQTLRKAKSITYPQDGASRGYIEKMFERLGIAAEVQPKIILAPGSGPATESVATGKAAMVITLFSEIVPVHGVEILGPLPGEFHYNIPFGAAASAAAKNAEAARALIAFLAGPKAAENVQGQGSGNALNTVRSRLSSLGSHRTATLGSSSRESFHRRGSFGRSE
jgi:molybdate transport system substrate-binding protein